MWHVNGWSNQKFPCFLAWATTHFPYAFGHPNHNRRLLDSFLPSVVQATHTCLASTLHACVPALGTPSSLFRIIDLGSINGRACFQPSMRLRILRGTCLGHFSGVHAWNIQTKNNLRALQQPLAQAKQPLPLAHQQFSGSAEPGFA